MYIDICIDVYISVYLYIHMHINVLSVSMQKANVAKYEQLLNLGGYTGVHCTLL